ncbi:hypothetical protein [Bacillus glycinifermentans]|uniref:hypothetical protein n=1 Tax=Bacillus glycinifermentans TaxID=1664069 RepID=UPI000BC307EB|nr:hypothetical protein [Bacillus glycinifermentans]ATH91715.1 hypothetical protein COP00_03060 [Bacillus glycinifermentans]
MSEIKKPVITKEQAELFEKLREVYTDEELVARYIDNELDLFDLGFTDFLAALINRYEVEKTPEEKVREYYATNYQRHEQSLPRSKDDFYTSGVAEGVRSTLDLLGIKIEGVNA